eukprot:103150_1
MPPHPVSIQNNQQNANNMILSSNSSPRSSNTFNEVSLTQSSNTTESTGRTIHTFHGKSIQAIRGTFSWNNISNKCEEIKDETNTANSNPVQQLPLPPVKKITINKSSITFSINVKTINGLKRKNICVDNSIIHYIYLLNKHDITACEDNQYFSKFFRYPPPEHPELSSNNRSRTVITNFKYDSALFVFVFKKP